MAVPPKSAWLRRQRLIEGVATALFTLFVAWPFLSLTQYVTLYDTITYAGPHLSFEWDQWRSGQLPDWNDAMFGGIPHMANPQAAVMYPVKLLFLPFDVARALELITAAHIFVLAGGMFFLLARRLQLRPPAAFLGTCAVVGSGVVMVRTTQFEQFAVIAWIPWLLAAIDWAASQPRVRPRAMAAIAAATAMLLVAGHPQQTYMAVPLAGIWAIARVVDHRVSDHAGALIRRFLTIGGGVLLGVCLAMPQLLVTTLQLTSSVNFGNRSLLQSADPSQALLPSLIPNALVGNTWADDPNISSGNFEAMGFVGVTVCVLALLGTGVAIMATRIRLTGIALALSAVGAVMLALGPECYLDERTTRHCQGGGYLYRRMFESLPSFDQARVPGRWLLLAVLSLAILSAFGLDALVRRAVGTVSLAISGALLAACLIGMKLTPVQIAAKEPGASVAVWIVAGVVTVGVIIAVTVFRLPRALTIATCVVVALLVVVELGGANRNSAARLSLVDEPFTAFGGATSTFLASQPDRNLSATGTPFDDYHYLSNAVRPNANVTYGSRSLDGYDGGVWVTRRWTTAVDPLTKEFFNPDTPLSWQVESPPDRELLARLGVKYLVIDAVGVAKVYGIVDPESPEARAKARLIAAKDYRGPVLVDGPLEVWENPNYTAEGQVYFRTVPVEQKPEPITVALGSVKPEEALVPPGSVELTCEGSCAPVPVMLDRPRPGAIDATLDIPRRGLFVIPEQGATGWTATVDGQPTSIISVDGMSQGIVLEPGRHAIELRYRAPGLRMGLLVMSLAFIVLVLCVWEPRFITRLVSRVRGGRPRPDEMATESSSS